MSDPYNKCPVGYTNWAFMGNTAIKTYLEKDPVAKTNIYIIFLTSHLWLLFFYYNTRTLTNTFIRELFSFLI